MKLFLSLMLTIFFSQQAKADWPHNLLEFKCLDEYGYALIRTSMLYNLGIEDTAEAKNLADKHGFYDLSYLNTHQPLVCQLPIGKVVVTVSDYSPPSEKGLCGGVEHANISVSLNDVVLVENLNSHGFCGANRATITVNEHGAEVCQATSDNQYEPGEANTYKCKHYWYKP